MPEIEMVRRALKQALALLQEIKVKLKLNLYEMIEH